MATPWTLTIDCSRPRVLAAFWASALGYAEPPPPAGAESWPDWLAAAGVPESEWDDGAYLADPAGVLPRISFLKVSEPKTVKNRLHLDVQVGGGRSTPWEQRWPAVLAEVDRLVGLGARVVREDAVEGRGDHVVMADPEGNEFCVL